MKQHNLLLLAASLSIPLVAQEGRPPQPKTQPERPAYVQGEQQKLATEWGRHALLSNVLGADVRMQPSAEARREAAEDNEQAERPKGEVADLILNVGDGSVDWAVLSVGGLLGIGDKSVAVPWRKLQHTLNEDGEPTFTIAMTKAELEARPAFDADDAKKRGLDTTVRTLDTSDREIGKGGVRDGEIPPGRPADGTGREPGERTDRGVRAGQPADASMPRGGTHYVLASDFKDCNLRTPTEEFGSVSKAMVDLDNHKIDYIVIARGGVVGIGETEYLVPLAACKLIRHDDEPALQIDRSVEELKTAPKYTAPENGRDPLNRTEAERACEFYHVQKKGSDRSSDPGKTGKADDPEKRK